MLSTLSSLTEETAVHHKHLQTHVQVLFITFLEPRVFKAGFTCLWPPHSFQQPPDHLAIVFFWHQWTFTCFRPTHTRARSTLLLSSPPLPSLPLASSLLAPLLAPPASVIRRTGSIHITVLLGNHPALRPSQTR